MSFTRNSSLAKMDFKQNTSEKSILQSNDLKTIYRSWRELLAEFISTLFLIFFGCMSCIPVPNITEQSSLYTPITFGLVVMFNIQSFGHISGAHMNPAVTLAAVVWGSHSILIGVLYTIVQCIGAITGYALLMAVSPIDLEEDSICVTSPHENLNVIQCFFVEMFLTALLVFINLAVWDPVNKDKQDSAPIKFGLTIIGLGLVGGHITGASMNPVRSFAPALLTSTWTVHWVYWVAPVTGSLVAVIIYKLAWLRYRETV